MEKKEIWKLVRHWIIVENRNRRFLEYVTLFPEQSQKFKSYHLEPCNQEEVREDAEFLIITPYLLRAYRGFAIEQHGVLRIENFQMIKQIAYDFENSSDNLASFVKAFRLIASFVGNEIYILNGLESDNLNYYQEKDVDGLYGRILETSHYMKLRNKASQNIDSKKVGMTKFYTREKLEVQCAKDFVFTHQEQQRSKIDDLSSVSQLTECQVEKVYQLL